MLFKSFIRDILLECITDKQCVLVSGSFFCSLFGVCPVSIGSWLFSLAASLAPFGLSSVLSFSAGASSPCASFSVWWSGTVFSSRNSIIACLEKPLLSRWSLSSAIASFTRCAEYPISKMSRAASSSALKIRPFSAWKPSSVPGCSRKKKWHALIYLRLCKSLLRHIFLATTT